MQPPFQEEFMNGLIYRYIEMSGEQGDNNKVPMNMCLKLNKI